MISENEIKTILLNIIELFNIDYKITTQKKSFFAVKNKFPLDQSALFINISNKSNFDIYITLTEQLKEKLIEKSEIKKQKMNIEDTNDVLTKLCLDFKNHLQKSFNISDSNNNKTITITQIKYIDKTEEIKYETILVLLLGTEISDIFIILGFNKLKFESPLSFIFYGFTINLIEELSTELIPKGIEIYNLTDPEEFKKSINRKKMSAIIIDYCMVKKSLSYFLDDFFYDIPFKSNLIFGISKMDITAFKTVPISSEKYQIIGLFLRSLSTYEIVQYILSSLKKANIIKNEKRKDIRIMVEDNNRCFAFIVEKGFGISSKIVNISITGFRGQLDNSIFFQHFNQGKELKLVNIYIKSFHIIVSCKIIYVSEPYFAVEFTYISNKDKENLSLALFHLLQENKYFLLD